MKAIRCAGIAAFLAVLVFPSLQMHFHFFPQAQYTENRELAKAPRWDHDNWRRFSSDCENYVGDNFGLRPELIRWNSVLKLIVLGVSPVPSVIPGKDSWLFYCSEALDDGNTINDFRGTIPLSAAELEGLQRKLEDNAREFEKLNIPYLVAIAPNKNTVYPEYLPDAIRRFHPVTRLDQVMAHMREHSKVKILDLRDALLKARGGVPLYWKTDSHWNTYGAYVGYAEIIRNLSGPLPVLHPVSIEGGKVSVKRTPAGRDLAQMLSMQDLLPEENETELNLSTEPDVRIPGTLVFRHDSFGDNLYPYLRRHFVKITNIAPFSSYKLDAIRDERPVAVLHVFAERYITQAIHDDFFHRDSQS